jgi:hypothetical protein
MYIFNLENILLQNKNDLSSLKIVDFGVSH